MQRPLTSSTNSQINQRRFGNLDYAPAGSREYHGLMYHLGKTRETIGQADEAIACFRTIFDADSEYLDVGRRLAKLTAV